MGQYLPLVSMPTTVASAPCARSVRDRRSRPTPILSRYWWTGRRRAGRRDGELQNVYVDRYSRIETLLFLWLLGASILDLVLTLVHIRAGGGEANPLMDRCLDAGGVPLFVSAKLGLTAVASFFLLLHARFPIARVSLFALGSIYACVLGYHVLAILDR